MTVVNVSAWRSRVGARRVGYVIAAVLTAGFWYVVNVRPGWSTLSFLTGEAAQVIALLDVSLAVSLVANVFYLAYDPPWFRSLGDLITTSVGLAVLIQIWQVFPFAFTGSFDWSPLVRTALTVAVVGSVIAIVVNLVALVRGATHRGRPGASGRRAS